MQEISGRVAAITGAASGIGRALAINFAQRGCHISISDVNEEGLAETVEQASCYGVKVTHQKLDVADRAAVYAWADKTAEDHGKVNFIINNAGVAVGAPVEQMQYEDIEWLMGINFWGVVYGSKAFLPYIKSAGEGAIVNVSSVFGFMGIPTQSAYCSAKFAVKGFTESLIQELHIEGSGIKAICVHPGGIKTNIAASARVSAEIKELADAEKVDLTKDFHKIARTTPDKAAKTIITGIEKGKRRVLIGADAKAIDKAQRWFPLGYQRVLETVAKFGEKKRKQKLIKA